MELLLWLTLGSIFLSINTLILKKDIFEKKIPNKYLLQILTILPLWYIYAWYFWYFSDIHVSIFLVQILLSFLVGFLLFHFKIWWAGDAKYLLVLWLFIPHIGITTFIGNIAIITIAYLLLYLLWFWFWPNLWIQKKRNELYKGIWKDIQQTIHQNRKNLIEKSLSSLLVWATYLVALFVAIRLIRFYIVSSITHDNYLMGIFSEIIARYNILFILWIIGLILWAKKWWVNVFYDICSKKLKIEDSTSKVYLVWLILMFLIWFIVYEYYKDPAEIISQLIKIFTYCTFIFLIFKILLYTYKIYYKHNHIYVKDIQDIEPGDIVDYAKLVKNFWEEMKLWFISKDQRNTVKNNGILAPNPASFFRELKWWISAQQIKILKEVFQILEKKDIEIQQVFAFWVFIFSWCILSLLFQNKIMIWIITFTMDLIQSL